MWKNLDFVGAKSIVFRLEYFNSWIFGIGRKFKPCRSTDSFVLSTWQTQNIHNAMETVYGCCSVSEKKNVILFIAWTK